MGEPDHLGPPDLPPVPPVPVVTVALARFTQASIVRLWVTPSSQPHANPIAPAQAAPTEAPRRLTS